MQHAIIIIFFLALFPCHAAVYRGEHAGRILVIDSDTLTYHYEDEHLPFQLTANKDCPAGSRCYRTNEGTTLEQHGDDWRIQNGMALNPYLPPVHDPVNSLFATEMPYAAALLSDIRYKEQGRFPIHNKAITRIDLHNPESGITHYLIEGGDYTAAERDALNQYLRAQTLASEYSRRECLARLPAAQRQHAAEQYHITIHETYTDDRYHSAHIHEQTPCGYSGHYGIIYSIKQARGIELEDLLWIGDGAPHLLADDNPADQNLRETRAAWLLDTLKAVTPQAMRDYPYRTRDYQYPYSYLTQHGLYIGPLLPPGKSAHAHPQGTILPYDLIKQHPGILGTDAIP